MIHKSLTIITLNTPGITDFAAARNAALAQAETDWVLFLDADETLTPDLEKEISYVLNHKSSFSAYKIRRIDFFLGRPLRHGETGHALFVRLARRDFGRWQRPVHEVWIGQGRVGELHSPLLHTPHPTLSSFLAKIDHYSTLEAKYRFAQGRGASLLHILVYPLVKFKLNYVWKLGFLDGTPGLIHALMMSFHSYLTWSKLYLLWRKK